MLMNACIQWALRQSISFSIADASVEKSFGARSHIATVVLIISIYVARVALAHQGRADRAGVDFPQTKRKAMPVLPVVVAKNYTGTTQLPNILSTPCAICGDVATREPADDSVNYIVHCVCCGSFELSDVVQEALETLTSRALNTLCLAARAEALSGRRLRLTSQKVTELVAAGA